jgi:heat shock protein HtpX
VTLQEQIRSNRLRTGIVLLGFAALAAALVAVVYFAYAPGLAGFIGIFAIGYGLFSWFFAGKVVAAASGAHPVSKQQQPELYRAVENAAIGAGLPKTPDVYLINDDAPNAFAAGRNPEHAYVAATTGLVAKLSQRELEAVMAHEIAHIRNRDVRLMSLAAVLVGVIALVADMLMRITIWGGQDSRNKDLGPFGVIIGIAAMILAPIGAALLQMALSRRREYLADASAAEITGDPEGMALALAKLRDDTTPLHTVTRATAHLFIESPLRDHKGLRSSLGGLFDTHPPLEDRIKRLAEAGGFPPP